MSGLNQTCEAFFYHSTGKQRRWDAIKSHSSIGVVVYHKDLKQLLIVRQFRPPVYATLRRGAASDAPPDLASGFTYELCAGILDKDKSLEEVACEEIEVRSSVANVPALGPCLIRLINELLPLHCAGRVGL